MHINWGHPYLTGKIEDRPHEHISITTDIITEQLCVPTEIHY